MSETIAPKAASSPWWRFWKELQDHDRGARAQLRRCGSTLEVAFIPAYHGLLRRLGSRLRDEDNAHVAMIAAVLAHIERPASAHSLAQLMGLRVTDTRFRHLLQTNDLDDLMRELIRVVRQLDRTAPIDAMANDLMRWDTEVKKRWAFDYYAAVPPKKERQS